ncbi:MAG: alcohol dehydrogenase catalytic domain-containing protein [Propionibacteriaceae bacterium]|jgi:threonine dehydrogenase-like Zn-dependent dehydrogenase|nr:alcohol dehydrogenase catalytic domain-containing protein [Propionibacteriaceae bacterium]
MTDHIPTTQRAVVFTGPDQIEIDPAKPLPPLGPTQLLLRMEACGICFSDTKLLHAFSQHPRKSQAVGGLTPAELATVAGYAPGDRPVTPGHEPVARIVAVGDQVRRHQVGERVAIQTDYRHLPTAASNVSFGYTIDGGLAEYTILDERVVIEPETGERFLIPVSERPSASAIALAEPWACVEASYAWGERRTPVQGGSLLVVADAGAQVEGLDELLAQAQPARQVTVGLPGSDPTTQALDSVDQVTGQFDDIVYFGSDPDLVEALGPRLASGGLMNLVTGGASFGRPVQIDVGRVHYDLIRYTGSTGHRPQPGYDAVPASCDLGPGDRVAVIGAAGPMGLMHAVRAITLGVPDVSLDAVDVNDERLAHLEQVLAPLAARTGAKARVWNSTSQPLPEQAYDYVALMVPAGPLVAQAIAWAGPGSVVNAFAGFAVGTMAGLDLDAIVERHVYLVGTSGSRIVDVATVVGRIEDGVVDTNISLDAISGLDGVPAAIASVIDRTSQGKIVVYPALGDMGLIRLVDLPQRLPEVAAAMVDGQWTKQAEEVLLRTVPAL